MTLFDLLTLLGGLALFLYGMEVMGDGLKKLAGGKLESILARLTSNRVIGFLLGFAVTAVIQSSSATTVMLVGFVNSGIMKLGQTISVIMGANIGTTVTAWLLSLTGISESAGFVLQLFKPSSFTPVLALIGIVMIMMSANDKRKNIASILLGFAVLMFGMDAMSGAMSGLKDSPAFAEMLVMFKNPILGILVGTILTAIIQSSSASVGILQALSLTGAISYSTAIPIILGQNIGTTITPILSALTGNVHSKRVAMSCLYIKMIGVAVVCGGFYALDTVLDFAFMDLNVSPLSIAVVHTAFNIVSTVILMPFCTAIEKLSIKTIKGKKVEVEDDTFATLDERFLAVPSFALEKCRELVNEMAEITKKALIDATYLLEKYDKNIVQSVADAESRIDKYEDKTSSYLVKISGKEMSTKDSHTVTELLHCIGDIERIADHAVNIADVAQELYDKESEFSPEAEKEVKVISEAIREVITLAVDSLVKEDFETAKKVEPLEQVIDKLKYQIKKGHIQRLKDGYCTVEMGFSLSDLLVNYERVSDHCSNIAVCILERDSDSFETHEYLSNVKTKGANDFFEKFEEYKNKYSI